MTYFIATFKSRASAMKYYDNLLRHRINAVLISTPTEISIGCGISVRMQESDFHLALKIYQSDNYSAFAGFYKVREIHGQHFFTSM